MHTLHLSLTEDVSSLGQSRAPMVVVVMVVVVVVVVMVVVGLVFPAAVAGGRRAQDRHCYC